MAKYRVITNQPPVTHPAFLGTPTRCHKLRKSSGKLEYQVNVSSNNQYVLEIDDISAIKRQSAKENELDSVTQSFDLSSILQSLVPGNTFGSASKLLPILPNHNDAKFVAAVLLNLDIIKIL
ncbi:hypothetical protein I2F27_06810 [Acinetobacter sp. B5B]|uniref:hypothetical protein n=1 Tax=Acinetobacter baretiae TaxID=2605383 RepID=UPI0018C2E546|nr:hypothetical protein [Acinetobacter baretiae]MBF7683036.1 hypothetical protein [Acinetobacter baretiae]